jgi:hypothetical protein
VSELDRINLFPAARRENKRQSFIDLALEIPGEFTDTSFVQEKRYKSI